MLYLRDRKMRYLTGEVVVSYSFFQRMRLLQKKLKFVRVCFFSYYLVFDMDIGSLPFSNIKNMSYLKRTALGPSFTGWLTNQKSFRILPQLFDLTKIESADQRLWEECGFYPQILIGHPLKPQ